MMPMTTPALSMLKVGRPGMILCNSGAMNCKREIAVDDRGHRAQEFERGLMISRKTVRAQTRSSRSQR